MIYLASTSPRRKQILQDLGVAFTVIDINIDEAHHPHETAETYVQRVAQQKAVVAAQRLAQTRLPFYPILAADTIVVAQHEILHKPTDQDHWRSMLRRLSGHTHSVFTSIALWTPERCMQRLSRNRVTFKTLSETEQSAYIKTQEGVDKAGGYAIQGQAAWFISHIEGSYTGIMGLPVYETGELLQDGGIEIWGGSKT